MYCSKCGAKIKEGTLFCTQCGVSLQNYPPVQEKIDCETEEKKEQENLTEPQQTAEKIPNPYPKFYGPQGGQNIGQGPKQYGQPQPQNRPMAYGMGNQPFYNDHQNIPIKNYDPSKDYTPIGMWGYFGYQLLFAIPIVGFILILVFSFGGTRNINLRNYARSTFCLLIVLIVIILLIMLMVALFTVPAFV